MLKTPASDTSERECIQQVLNDFADAWNVHNAKLFSRLFAVDADFTNVKGVYRHGRTAFEEFHAPFFKTVWSSSTLKIKKSTIRFIRTDVAAIDAWWDLDGLKAPDGSGRPPRTGLLMFIMTRQENSWLITVMHNMDLPESVGANC
ncbi:MAG TPA: SgcJ/EcaC family oxidoreductase [Chitinophagaceae bacterium]|nr:SgcJ/EcaC family oxidoreductase [Chitinophagaceae bacterium]